MAVRTLCNIDFHRNSAKEFEGVIQVAVVRDFTFRKPFTFPKPATAGRVVEPELDMNRLAPRDSALARVVELIRWLTPLGRSVVGTPSRSVGRELEEAWPSNEQ